MRGWCVWRSAGARRMPRHRLSIPYLYGTDGRQWQVREVLRRCNRPTRDRFLRAVPPTVGAVSRRRGRAGIGSCRAHSRWVGRATLQRYGIFSKSQWGWGHCFFKITHDFFYILSFSSISLTPPLSPRPHPYPLSKGRGGLQGRGMNANGIFWNTVSFFRFNCIKFPKSKPIYWKASTLFGKCVVPEYGWQTIFFKIKKWFLTSQFHILRNKLTNNALRVKLQFHPISHSVTPLPTRQEIIVGQ